MAEELAQAATVIADDPIQGTTAVINVLEDPQIVEALNTIEDRPLGLREHETIVKTVLEREAEKGIPDSIMDRELERRHLIPLREIVSAKSHFLQIRNQVANTQAKISALDAEIAIREQKIQESPNEEARRIQERKRDELIDTKNLHLQSLSALRADSQNQLAHIRESIKHFLNDDTTLGERLRNLFREQGVTIVSIFTALSMIISTLVVAITGGGSAVVTPPPPPSDKVGIKDWVKQRLQDLGRLLGKLAGKATAALPGVIGSIVSWLLSTAQKAVGWLAQNLWALVVGIAGLLYLTAKDYITMKRLTPPPKKD